MPDYAGYAIAVTIHDRVFNDQLLVAYHGGQFKHLLAASFGQVPLPNGNVNFFLQPPQVVLSDSDPTHGIIRLNGWGTMYWQGVPPEPGNTRSVQWQADVLITPQVSTISSVILLTAKQADYQLVAWQFDVLSGTPFPAATQAFFTSAEFEAMLEGWLKNTIGDILIPIVDFSQLGPFQGVTFSNVALKVTTGGLLLGLDVSTTDFSTNGDPSQLKDLAGANDVEVVLNPDAIKPLMPKINQQVQDEITQYGATLNSLTITCEEGQFRVKGAASMSDGSATFSLAAVPSMTYETPGAVMPLYTGKIMVIPPHFWPAISFVPADPSVDVNQAGWITVLTVIGSVLTLGMFAFMDLSIISQTEWSITTGIQGSNLNPDGATPLVQRIGTPPTRFKIEQFEIHDIGVYIGISTRLEAPPAALSGLNSIPANLVAQTVRYDVNLPFDALPDDPFLNIRWTVIDLDSGTTLLSDDNLAAGRSFFQFIPSTVGPQTTRFAVGCRIYRALGPFITDLFNQTIRLTAGPALAPGAFVTWTYTVKNPQVKFDNTLNQWIFISNRQLQRRSKIHRVDKPCKNANKRSRFTPTVNIFDELPFPISQIVALRTQLCPYCFFGGPGSIVASL